MATDLVAVEGMVLFLGEFLEDLLEEMRRWPKWSIHRKHRWIMEGKLIVATRAIRHWETLLLDAAGGEEVA